jgi:hypothetical protein
MKRDCVMPAVPPSSEADELIEVIPFTLPCLGFTMMTAGGVVSLIKLLATLTDIAGDDATLPAAS